MMPLTAQFEILFILEVQFSSYLNFRKHSDKLFLFFHPIRDGDWDLGKLKRTRKRGVEFGKIVNVPGPSDLENLREKKSEI